MFDTAVLLSNRCWKATVIRVSRPDGICTPRVIKRGISCRRNCAKQPAIKAISGIHYQRLLSFIRKTSDTHQIIRGDASTCRNVTQVDKNIREYASPREAMELIDLLSLSLMMLR